MFYLARFPSLIYYILPNSVHFHSSLRLGSVVTMGLGPTRISPTGKRWIATNAVLLALATTAVLLRLWARRLRGKALVLNDYAIVLSLVSTSTRTRSLN